MRKKVLSKVLAVALGLSMIASMAACSPKKEEAKAPETKQESEVKEEGTEAASDAKNEEAPAEMPGKGKKVALICDVAGTQVFILDMIEGFHASAEKWGFEPIVSECADAGAFEDNARALLEEGVDLLIGGGWQTVDVINKLATEFPDKTQYALIDSIVDAPNVKCVSFREQEGAYLIGKIAAMTTEGESSNVYGGVHVMQGPGSFKWRWGFMEGVKSIRPDAKFVFNYVGSFNDPAKSKEYALQQFEAGCKFINAAAAGGDKGVFEAAKEKGFYTSGQDVDLTSPDNEWIVSSQIKDTKQTVINLMDSYFEDWNTENVTWGVSDGTIGAVYVTHESPNPRSPKLTDEHIKELKATVEKINSKEIDLSVVPDESTYQQ